jgi:phage anti-repressor protein
VARELARIDVALRFSPVAKVQQIDPAVQLAPVKPVTQIAALVATGTDGLGGNFRAIAESQDEYPVDFDDAWEWVYESRKDSAKRALVKDFVEGVDYIFLNTQGSSNARDGISHRIVGNSDVCDGGRGRPSEKIYLTVDCFKQFCMMAGTPRGKQVRLHYLEIERKFKAAQAALSTTSSHNVLSRGLEGELGRIHAKLDAVIDGTARFNAWATKTEKTTEQRHVEIITKMDTLNTKAERANFSSKTEKLAIECLVEEFQGRCPITDRIIVDKNGKYLELDLHHIDGVSSNRSPSNCCPLSKEGHQAFHGNSTDLQMNSQIKAWQVRFQMFLARKETPLLIGLM